MIDDDGDNGDDGDDDYGIPNRLGLFDGSLYFSFRLPHTWPDVEEHMFEMSVIVTNVIDVFGSVSRLAWAVGKRLGAILGCPGAILGRLGSVLEPS